jgi:hypothetical protein
MNFDGYDDDCDDSLPLHICCSVPVCDLGSDSTVTCRECRKPLSNEDECYSYSDGVFCLPCGDLLAANYWLEAREFAMARSAIKPDLPKYEGDSSFKCTPEQYAAGEKMSDTPNAHFCSCRHEYTNYEQLIADLDCETLRDKLFYAAIRSRIDKLVAERLQQLELEDDELTE